MIESQAAAQRRAGPAPQRQALGLAVWAGLIAAAAVWGVALQRSGAPLHLPAPPLFARPDPHLSPRLLLAVAVAALVVAGAGRATATLRWRPLLLAVTVTGAVWAAALALADGPGALTAPLLGPHDYLHDLPLVGAPGDLLAGFTDGIGAYTTHVRGHPPAMLLLAWGLARAGLGQPGLLAALVVVAGASAGAAALVALREVAGEAAARRAAPFLTLAPAAVWVATSADALFAGVGAWGVALVVLATRRRGGHAAQAVCGGILLGVSVFLSYGLVLLGVVPAVVAWRRRCLRTVALAAAGGAAVAVAFAAGGFLWWEGLAATRAEYLAGAGGERPYGYFLLAAPAALAVAVGPACAAGLAGTRDRAVRLLAGGGLLAVGIAALSGMSKGEVERIWLPFMPWLLVAAACLPPAGGRAGRRWLGAQATTALAVEALMFTPW